MDAARQRQSHSNHSKRPFPQPSKHLHSTFAAHGHRPSLDSPAYDASEEDNDPLTDDGASAVSVSSSTNQSRSRLANAKQGTAVSRGRHALASTMLGGGLISSDEGVDSPTYDGDIESSTTAGPDGDPISRTTSGSSYQSAPSIASTLSPESPSVVLPTTSTQARPSSVPRPTASHPSIPIEPPPVMPIPLSASGTSSPIPTYPLDPLPTLFSPDSTSASPSTFNPATLTPEDIQAHFRSAIDSEGIAVGTGEDKKVYKINEPPKNRPVRIYADGVYDLFHFGHALQLRQAKLAFPNIVKQLPLSSVSPVTSPPSSAEPSSSTDSPSTPSLTSASIPTLTTLGTSTSPATSVKVTQTPSGPVQTQIIPGVYLLVGVNSDLQCAEHKSRTVMTHAERCESVRHCRWVDEVVPDAPWIIDEEFLQKYKIDYVAHDQDPYGSAGHDDVYAYCKSQGKFLPTLRTPGISTSDLLARLVSGYRHRVWDKKLEKMGLRDLMAEGSDWDESRGVSREGSPPPSAGASVSSPMNTSPK
ncbi:hypothetical protein K474DRAFT_1707164 [Panus rudis PR-1116 ss-1]|nr:hypothetical protein K474DRAFT_1707164 [Panus rudis PR-1116 ss-1]